MKQTVIYCANNVVTGHAYIGLTCDYLCRRRGKHVHCAFKLNSQTHFHRALRKYGKENFTWSILATAKSYDEGKELEIRFISDLKPHYNMTKGGDGTVGFKMPPELVERLVESRRGRPGPWTGKELPLAFWEGGRIWRKSQAAKQHWRSASKLGPKSIQKRIVCLNDGMEFASIRSAARHYGVSESSINAVCHRSKVRFSVRGMVFRYVNDLKDGEHPEKIVIDARQRQLFGLRSAQHGMD